MGWKNFANAYQINKVPADHPDLGTIMKAVMRRHRREKKAARDHQRYMETYYAAR